MKNTTKKLNELTLSQALEGLKNRDFTSVALVNACFEQIDKHDGVGAEAVDKVNAFITLTKKSALTAAKKADDLIAKDGEAVFVKKPLLGIPYACKDNFCTKDIKTTAASNILKDFIPPYESTVTKRLKNAGAILLGKTNLDAFAHGSSTETSDFCTTKNPWDLTRIPGGSSGGSAAAVAANMCTFAIGSETAGSIRLPAAWCGVTGFKPTYGRVSRYGVIAMASSTDSPGPLTKSTLDAALILEVIAGKDNLDATSLSTVSDNYSERLREDNSFYDLVNNARPLKGLRLGKPKSYFDIGMTKEFKQKIEMAVRRFEDLGAKIVEIDLIDPKYSIALYTIVQRSEVSSNLGRFDGVRYGNSRNSFNFENKKRIMLGSYALSSGFYDAYYSKAQKVRTLVIKDFERAFKDIDLIICPVTSGIAPKLGASDQSPMFGELIDMLQEPSAVAGLCGINIPCGFNDGLPVGVQLIGPQLADTKVLQVAHVYQKATGLVQSADLEKSTKNLKKGS